MLMNNWFECKVKTEKTLENGTQKKVTEPYLVDALNFTEAEARIIREISPYCNGELEVVDIKRVKYSEMFTNEAESADKWYKVKAMFITLDEKSQTEKKSATFILVQASDFQNAVDTFVNGMKGGMSDYEIHTIQETNILDVFPFEAVSREKLPTTDDTPNEEEQFSVKEGSPEE
ncbi:MAG: DUF4494 domain-containing protein [Bacteroidaceae bacterium]|nr:DUF4494 domain-containing protein [Bacteroidaceae bacterium]